MDKLEVITPQGRNGGEVILWGLGEEFKGREIVGHACCWVELELGLVVGAILLLEVAPCCKTLVRQDPESFTQARPSPECLRSLSLQW